MKPYSAVEDIEEEAKRVGEEEVEREEKKGGEEGGRVKKEVTE